jgi:hypothetical protein
LHMDIDNVAGRVRSEVEYALRQLRDYADVEQAADALERIAELLDTQFDSVEEPHCDDDDIPW